MGPFRTPTVVDIYLVPELVFAVVIYDALRWVLYLELLWLEGTDDLVDEKY